MTSPASVRHVEHCMGTVFSFDVRTPGFDPRTFDDAAALLHDIDRRFSTYRDDSEISRLAAGTLPEAQCSPDVRWALHRCRELEAETAGYFSAYAAGSLDPSGLVKGWAIETVSDLLEAAGSTSHCVNGGGDVQCVGEAAPGTAWRVGVVHPFNRTELATVIDGADFAVATSGSAERGAHVVDPHTGRPPSTIASVTLIGPRLSDVDAYATAAFAMDSRARAWLETLEGYSAFGVDVDGSMWRTAATATR